MQKQTASNMASQEAIFDRHDEMGETHETPGNVNSVIEDILFKSVCKQSLRNGEDMAAFKSLSVRGRWDIREL